jgi:GNAT superfamily N-acetyltransferase
LSPVVEVVRTYLELRTPADLRGVDSDDPLVRFVRHDTMSAAHYRRLYHAVGDRWHWRDRNAWSDERLENYLASAGVTVWECTVGDASAGYFELEHRTDGTVEVAYFGLTPDFVGRGLGKVMLTRAAREALALDAALVWLHTCTLDSPHALANYKARGFREVRTESFIMQLP